MDEFDDWDYEGDDFPDPAETPRSEWPVWAQ